MGCCICDGCFGTKAYKGETLGQHEYCKKHLAMIKKVIKLYKEEKQ